MNTTRLPVVVVGCALLFSPLLFSQGALTPPPGPPVPGMKTLEQVEPRTPISGLPFTIAAPGSYYLTGTLTHTSVGGNAITIASSNVTLDLNGFTLDSSAAASGVGIRILAGAQRITLRNGRIVGTTAVAVSGSFPNRTWVVATPGGFDRAIVADPPTRGLRVEGVVVAGCRAVGFDLAGAAGASIEDCAASSCAAAGFLLAEAAVVNCAAQLNGGVGFDGLNNSQFARCVALDNGGVGFNAVRGIHDLCRAVRNAGSGFVGSAGVYTTCYAGFNQGHGLILNEGLAQSCSARNNAQDGIRANNGNIVGCSAMDNLGTGISAAGGRVSDSISSFNFQHGIQVQSSVLSFSRAAGNNRAGEAFLNISDNGTSTRTGNNPAP